MAIFRFSAGVIKRSEGRSATAAAAYRAGMEIADARTGETFDYTRKAGILHNEIVAPAGAPAWMRDRAELWNGVELAENRKDAQLAREVQLALPHELTTAQQIDLAREFVAAEFVARGMVADIAIHAPDREGDDRNAHAHIMLTMREIDGDGFGKKAREWNDKVQLELWREAWAGHANRVLEREGHEARIDHRTLEEQGIDREPSIHLGPTAMEMERRGIDTGRGDDNRAIEAANEQRRQIGIELDSIEGQIAKLEQARELTRFVNAIWEKFEQPPPSTGDQAETPPSQRQTPDKLALRSLGEEGDVTRAPAARDSENVPEPPAVRRKRAPNRYALLIERQNHPERAKEIDDELERRRQLERDRER